MSRRWRRFLNWLYDIDDDPFTPMPGDGRPSPMVKLVERLYGQ